MYVHYCVDCGKNWKIVLDGPCPNCGSFLTMYDQLLDDKTIDLGKAWTVAPENLGFEEEGHFEGGFYYNPIANDTQE